MTSITNHAGKGRHGPKQGRRLATLLLTASIAAGAATRAGAQPAPPMRMWAAQTGLNQVTLTWEQIPGAVEYRIFAGDPDAPGTTPAARRAIVTLSGSGRYAIITGMNRVAGGLYLEAIGADRRRLRKVAFNPVTAATGMQTVTAPAQATATVTGPGEITLTWTPVQGATAYVIGRAVSPNGLQMLCRLCPTQASYLDQDITPGVRHSYTVAAIFPNGLSQRTLSNIVTPGVVAAAPPTQTPTTGYTPPGQPAGGTTTYTPPGTSTPTVQTPTTGYPPPGQPAGGTTTYTPPGTSTPTVQTPPATTTPTPTTGSTTQSTGYLGPLVQQLDSLRSWVAAATGGPLQQVTAADTAQFRQLVLQLDALRSLAVSATGRMLQSATLADSTPLQQGLGQFEQQLDALRTSVLDRLGSVLTGQTTTQTHAATPAWTGPCRLDYQRADNMWAAFGRPVGSLGTESISLLDGQTRIFITDWKYEKLRNDGANYYGSHLRIATNPGARPVWLRTHTALAAGWLTLNAGETKSFQADLDEVSCTNR
jgi:hypothetical protein